MTASYRRPKSKAYDVAILCAGVALAMLLCVCANAQCNPGPVFDPNNLSLGAALGTGNCPGGNCNRGTVPLSAPAAAASASSTAMGTPAPNPQDAQTAAIVAQVLRAMQSQGQTTTYGTNAYVVQGGYKPLRVAQHGSAAAAASATAGGGETYYEAPQPAPATGVVQLGVVPLQAPVIPVALAGTSSASSASSGGGGCNGGGRGFFRRANRVRTTTRTNANGNRSSATSVSTSR